MRGASHRAAVRLAAGWLSALCAAALAAEPSAISADALRRLAGEAERTEISRARWIDPLRLASSLDDVLRPATPRAEPSARAGPEPRVAPEPHAGPPARVAPEPRAEPSARAGPEPRVEPAAARPRAKRAPDYVYRPPPRRAGGVSNSVDAPKPRASGFGIRLGSWISASMPRATSSADSGLTELRVVEPVIGDRRRLPAGAAIFADKRFNAATGRLDLIARRGLLPNGEEFSMHGLVHDRQRRPGLSGRIGRDPSSPAAAAAAAAEVGDGMLRSALPTPLRPLADMARRAIVGEPAARARRMIRVAAQPVWIQVQESF